MKGQTMTEIEEIQQRQQAHAQWEMSRGEEAEAKISDLDNWKDDWTSIHSSNKIHQRENTSFKESSREIHLIWNAIASLSWSSSVEGTWLACPFMKSSVGEMDFFLMFYMSFQPYSGTIIPVYCLMLFSDRTSWVRDLMFPESTTNSPQKNNLPELQRPCSFLMLWQ